MARLWYGGTPADVAVTEDGTNSDALIIQASATLSVYDARSGGTQVTDLLDSSGSPITQVTTSSRGDIESFQGPDDYEDDLYVDVGTAPRYRLAPSTETAFARLSVLESGAASSIGFGANTVSVIDYGADPTGSADSLSAFNNAIAAVKGSRDGTVVGPAGLYRVVSTGSGNHLITLPGNVTMKGFGRARGLSTSGTTIRSDGACLSVVNITGYRAAMFDLAVDGDDTAASAIAINGPEARLRGVLARGADIGINANDSGTDSTSSRRVDLSDFHIERCRIGLWQEGPDWIVTLGRIIPESSNPDYMVYISGSSGQYSHLHTTGSGSGMLANVYVGGANNTFGDLYLDTCTTGPLLDVQAWGNKFLGIYGFWGTGGTPGTRPAAAINVGSSKENNQFQVVQLSEGGATNPWEYAFAFGNATTATNTVLVSCISAAHNTAFWNTEPQWSHIRDAGTWKT